MQETAGRLDIDEQRGREKAEREKKANNMFDNWRK